MSYIPDPLPHHRYTPRIWKLYVLAAPTPLHYSTEDASLMSANYSLNIIFLVHCSNMSTKKREKKEKKKTMHKVKKLPSNTLTRDSTPTDKTKGRYQEYHLLINGFGISAFWLGRKKSSGVFLHFLVLNSSFLVYCLSTPLTLTYSVMLPYLYFIFNLVKK